MNKYIDRMTPVWAKLTKALNHSEVAMNRFISALAKINGPGQYLIKKTDKWECLMGIGYMSGNYRGDNFGIWSTRKNAQWFTKEEALELAKGWKHVKTVKL